MKCWGREEGGVSMERSKKRWKREIKLTTEFVDNSNVWTLLKQSA